MVRKRFGYAVALAGTLAFVVPTFAQKPANAPANATAQCTDGTYSTAKTQKGACAKHGGVKTWWGAADEKTATSSTKTAGKKTTEKTSASSGAAASDKSTGAVPKGATGQCADGTYTRAKTEKNGCSNHGGVKAWFAASTSTPATPSAVTPAAPAKPIAPASKPVATPKPPTEPSSKAVTTTRPADAPVDATAKCKDGTYSTSKTHSGACSHHGGVAEWYK